MSVTGHKETIDHVEPLEELLEGLAVEAFEELLCQLLVGFSSVNAPAGFEACAPAVRSLFAAHLAYFKGVTVGSRHCSAERKSAS